MIRVKLTRKQKKILDFIEDFTERNGYGPTLQEIADYMGLSAVSGIHKYLKILESKGFIKRDVKKARAIEVIKEASSFPEIPIMGYITAGEPVEEFEVKEYMQVPPEFISGGEYFILKVKGSSMIDAYIVEGDFVVVRKQESAENGQMVVALIDNRETTLKKFYRKNGKIILKPENSAMEPMVFEPERVKIQGVVVGVLRKY